MIERTREGLKHARRQRIMPGPKPSQAGRKRAAAIAVVNSGMPVPRSATSMESPGGCVRSDKGSGTSPELDTWLHRMPTATVSPVGRFTSSRILAGYQ